MFTDEGELDVRAATKAISRGVAALALVVAGSVVGAGAAQAAVDPTAAVVINEVYGGGGNSGGLFDRDFIELRNTSTAAVDLSGWSVQYGSATNSSFSGITPLT